MKINQQIKDKKNHSYSYTTLLLLLVHYTALSSSLVQIQNDKFHGYINGIYQKVTDNSGQEWEFPAHKERLELLRNDQYLHDSFTTCYKIPSSSAMNQSGDGIVSFIENAKVC